MRAVLRSQFALGFMSTPLQAVVFLPIMTRQLLQHHALQHFEFVREFLRAWTRDEILRNQHAYDKKLFQIWHINIEEEGWSSEERLSSLFRAAHAFNEQLALAYLQNPTLSRKDLESTFAGQSDDIQFDLEILLELSPLRFAPGNDD